VQKKVGGRLSGGGRLNGTLRYQQLQTARELVNPHPVAEGGRAIHFKSKALCMCCSINGALQSLPPYKQIQVAPPKAIKTSEKQLQLWNHFF